MKNYQNISQLANRGGYLRDEDHVYVLPDGAKIENSVTSIIEIHGSLAHDPIATYTDKKIYPAEDKDVPAVR